MSTPEITTETPSAPVTSTTRPRSAERRGRRGLGVLAVVVTIATLALSGCLNSNQAKNQRFINNSRTSRGLPALSIHMEAQNKAQAWANKLARENRIYHSTLSSGISSRWCRLGENVGYGSTTEVVHKSFMNSTQHRNNILGSAWNGVGVGVARNGDTAFVVHVFIQAC